MCVGVPMQVLRLESPFAVWCRDASGGEALIDIGLIAAPQPGDWLLTFLGAAREVIDEQTAAQIQSALAAVAAALDGEHDLDAHFADLINREPQLPEFLLPAKESAA
ncbi:HypC/HybG/HupF family hydrogenase formation chaperone [Rivihabitans pingtungensis]|jgi:hydrogenase expression/formation protein HypC|uniref:Hydrogenase expression/formation protein HypC n=1 Tax=Rivihabitans pingtungensis TaxID=1054498 RepID=A0A318KWR1_9NEIS|nr:HypC/HybG/HupF family hydrogenase formation chaperone [Rivihabitans pingtungensis]PXX82019.1 hydrogenase expression/formation protein HypC [Rivihabitans pingtungensis]HNX71376.1 HypC/HybG/HupF family hydrogenase formation chaperone [Rivihabitans pingtungensis]